ncbi:hypothetical protein TREMEDRAFT_64803 [Tremella mesenterica DSM 1558]|uniref:uncharacterized protein n=1 Tax=Tremella mesenterica (strain ATCC 24925 / CBS 8224 / DSM 1558 / NBRC 9311 / NRRL Y-6157 / RJB 2259-6 / UBC 559-6) TaxID=578456 RepID=UPI0003F492DD|nr:uncharacterized protein TREMEDRAFT_64803 [Tremella mesenterica DSM 1558]EIW66945.1 hypothetical protein TREMEDRAFT_64803 [Tremella mesenterica DSM 1558]
MVSIETFFLVLFSNLVFASPTPFLNRNNLLPRQNSQAPFRPLSSQTSSDHSIEGGWSSQSSSLGRSTPFDTCAASGTVDSINIDPCSAPDGEICEFHSGLNYTITIHFTPQTSSSNPRNNLVAYSSNESLGQGIISYPYSGQSFDVDYLMFNITDGIEESKIEFLVQGYRISVGKRHA